MTDREQEHQDERDFQEGLEKSRKVRRRLDFVALFGDTPAGVIFLLSLYTIIFCIIFCYCRYLTIELVIDKLCFFFRSLEVTKFINSRIVYIYLFSGQIKL